jgi:hypothetical protein
MRAPVLFLLLAGCSERPLDISLLVDNRASEAPDLAAPPPDLARAPRDLARAAPDLARPGDLSTPADLAHGCGDFDSIACLPGQFCEYPAGMCAVDGYGVCLPRPSGCDGENQKQPECGCDRVTYSNDCQRRAAGVPLFHLGACSTSFACGAQTCAPGDACWQDCCGAAGCTPPPPRCVTPSRLPNCSGCDCFVTGSVCGCSQSPDGRIDVACTGCP